MRNFLKAVAVTLVGALAFVYGPTPAADAQVSLRGLQVLPFDAEYASNFVSAADTEPALVIKFHPGATTTAADATTVANVANTSITFVVNAAAYAGFECPVSGALGGVIDVTNAACNTLGEVVDVINSTASSFTTGYFRAAIVNGLRSDDSGSLLADAADADVRSTSGEVIYFDSSFLDDNTVAANFSQADADLAKLYFSISGNKLAVNKNPFARQDSVLLYAAETITNAGTVGLFQAYCVVESYKDGGVSSETVRTLYSEAGAATTATGKIDEFTSIGGLGCRDGKVLVRILASGADTSAVSLFATGFRFVRP